MMHNNTIDVYTSGTVVIHKATNKRCVVISTDTTKGTVKVRTSDDLERDYYPQEMITAEQQSADYRAMQTAANSGRSWDI